MKVAIVTDPMSSPGGSDRMLINIIESLEKEFSPQIDIYTNYFDSSKYQNEWEIKAHVKSFIPEFIKPKVAKYFLKVIQFFCLPNLFFVIIC